MKALLDKGTYMYTHTHVVKLDCFNKKKAFVSF